MLRSLFIMGHDGWVENTLFAEFWIKHFVKHTIIEFSVVVIEKHWRGVTKRSVCDEFWSKVLKSDTLQVSLLNLLFYFPTVHSNNANVQAVPPVMTIDSDEWVCICISICIMLPTYSHNLQIMQRIIKKIFSIQQLYLAFFFSSRKFHCSRYVFVSVYRGNLFFLGIVENEVRACWL